MEPATIFCLTEINEQHALVSLGPFGRKHVVFHAHVTKQGWSHGNSKPAGGQHTSNIMLQLFSEHMDAFQFLFFGETRSDEPLLPASELKNNLHLRYPSIISVLTTWPIHEVL